MQSGEHALRLSCDNAGTERGQASADLVGGEQPLLLLHCFISPPQIDPVPQRGPKKEGLQQKKQKKC